MTDVSDKTHVKILVYTKQEDGYPPEEWESLWEIPMGNNKFKIDNIPFYAKNLSCDDIVEAIPNRDDYVFKNIVISSENSTIRVVIYDLMDERSVRNELVSLGCSSEGTGTLGLIAVNVPKYTLNDVLNFMENAFADERLDFEEGALR